jgi:hypothetical protein
MSQDPVDVAEKLHDIESSKRLAEQDRLEAEFRRDPDWDLVAEHLIKRETVGDLCFLIKDLDIDSAYVTVKLAIEQCAREYAEREAGK